jgi:D-amino-acid dehydrogenase
MSDEDQKTLVIGAGIVGLACAYFLNAQGRSVRIIHDTPLNATASCGNAGAIAMAEIIPLAGPETLLNAPKWLVDPLGPLSIRASYVPKLWPWFWRFVKAGTLANRRALTQAMAGLLKTALDDHQTVLAAAKLGHLLKKEGSLFIYRSEQARLKDQKNWDMRRDCGVEFKVINRAGVLEFEPALGPLAVCGYRVEDWAHYCDPSELVVKLSSYLKTQGVEFEFGQVIRTLKENNRSVGVQLASGATVACDQLVVAAGAWSAQISNQLGDYVPLETERGYNTTLPDTRVKVHSFVTFSQDQFVMAPMQMGLRIGGAVELAGLETPPNYDRAKALVCLAKKYIPGLSAQGGTEWMGHRPSTPDSVPVISPSQKYKNVYYAFGHGHLGLTGSMTTGRLIAELVSGKTLNIDLTPFHVGRF